MVPALCGHPACSELGQDLSLRQSGREGVEGRGAGRRAVGCATCRWGRRVVASRQTLRPSLTHLDVCRFGFSPGGGGEEQPGNSRDPVCDDSFSRRGWKRRRHCWQIAGFPSPFLRWGLVTCGWSGNPLSSAAQRGPLVGGRWRPWRPLYNSAATKASPEGFAVEAAGLPAPRCFRPSLPLVAPPTLGLEQVGGLSTLGEAGPLASHGIRKRES